MIDLVSFLFLSFSSFLFVPSFHFVSLLKTHSCFHDMDVCLAYLLGFTLMQKGFIDETIHFLMSRSAARPPGTLVPRSSLIVPYRSLVTSSTPV